MRILTRFQPQRGKEKLPWDILQTSSSLGMKYAKNVDLYDSVAKGEGLLPFYSIEREVYLGKNGTEVEK